MNGLRTAATIFAGLLAFLSLCTRNSMSADNGGGGSETVNARVVASLNAIAVSVESHSRKNIEIGFFAADFNPLADTGFSQVRTSFDSTHDASMDSLRAGRYNVLVWDSAGQKAVLFRDVTLPSLQQDTMHDTLSPTASVSGTIIANGTMVGYRLATRINGTPLLALADSTRHFSLTGIPSGNTTMIISADTSVINKNYRGGPQETTVSMALDPGMAFDSLVVNIGN